MSKYRKGALYLRHMKPTDKSNDFRTSMRMALFSDKSAWKRPEEIKPVVLLRHGTNRVMNVFMNMDDALSCLFSFGIPKRPRNSRFNAKRGLRFTKGDLRKAFRKWSFKHIPECAV
ncbi:hypothetical protein [Kluyvera genomosp. 3]|uniref:Uncharacterized protein n=1 Tax=Kluyvera genomosp. 3 TaxID=2774055 RepID=A0A6G9RL42_9ENTR|nr:hypothetical protein [Kluyvera genomosp. 3]QIR27542.1 hypothetical protein GY169_12340 [Kluyvera genomosp. 3]